jgi:tRNA-dihydrouridine synthase B
MKLGPYTLPNHLFVAPMAGVTDRPFRQLCKRLGAGYAVSEMIASNAMLWNSPKTLRRANHDGEVEPISVQIAGADPDMMAEAAILNVDRGAQIIDINMGCPAKKVCNVASGSALLKDEVLVGRILEKIVSSVKKNHPLVPVTLKIRTGWDRDNKNALNIARIAVNSGIEMLTIHGRTKLICIAVKLNTTQSPPLKLRSIFLWLPMAISTPQKKQPLFCNKLGLML